MSDVLTLAQRLKTSSCLSKYGRGKGLYTIDENFKERDSSLVQT